MVETDQWNASGIGQLDSFGTGRCNDLQRNSLKKFAACRLFAVNLTDREVEAGQRRKVEVDVDSGLESGPDFGLIPGVDAENDLEAGQCTDLELGGQGNDSGPRVEDD